MNKNNVIGFGLIGLVFLAFFYYNQPNPESIAREKARKEQLEKENAAATARMNKELADEKERIDLQKNDSESLLFPAFNGIEDTIVLKNNNLSISIATKGANVTSATLLNYKDQKGNNLTLFNDGDKIARSNENRNSSTLSNYMNITFQSFRYGDLKTSNLYFKPLNVSDSTVTMRMLTNDAKKYIDFVYTLPANSYMLNLAIEANGMDDIIKDGNIDIEWEQLMRQQEKGHTFEQRYSSVTYKIHDDDSDYLSETNKERMNFEEEDEDENKLDWVAFKNQFFSCIMISGEKPFTNAVLASEPIEEGKGFLKDCYANMQLPYSPTGNATHLQFYFGPNHFGTLADHSELVYTNGDYEAELEDLIYFGWPIVRWFNRWGIMYLFDWLTDFGINMGIVLLILTIIVKMVVYPFTRKSYISSAKMRVLKPQIDAINAKYPNPEDVMKKQQEIMNVYNQHGASPMGGCLPMLIQMPIFIALFTFVPSAIELRQQSFLWVDDLSAYDAIISWDTYIWPIGNHISLFCLLFCVTQILNTYYTQKMQPASIDPQQEASMKFMRWFMYIMPVLFFFMFNEYSAGLNYYYFLSTLISVGTFIYLRYAVKEDDLLKKMEEYREANKNNPQKRSNMMARLEALQEQQRQLEEMRKKNQRK